ncbi:hypothetical protein [Cupriavidus pauculus]|uniref:hypothetical protein n=1 Tax=Cupriavidus pauculus TaxID=82633 RepID=UPI001EE22658|nr:hypothetical protein [Cupriavidus pauculus]GJG94310.1 hypothetical protein CBA19C6_07495 [Cupriavidus pauculus]
MTQLSYVPHAATLASQPSRQSDKPASGWWANYWAGGWDLYRHNAEAIAQAFMPPAEAR